MHAHIIAKYDIICWNAGSTMVTRYDLICLLLLGLGIFSTRVILT